MAKQYETVIGLEVHVELATKTKIFCSCSTEFGGAPNTHTCPVCTGMPGSLPVLNKQVVEYAMAIGLATNCDITKVCKFDRKNYFYPDNPQNYQISQLYLPICHDGWVEIETSAGKKKVRIHEMHMEEDAGKLIHDEWDDTSLVDYNRSGVPLVEIVSEPDMRSADEVIAYLEKLRMIIQYLGASDCKLQEGSMRADVNLSVREVGTEKFGTRTEMKNLNSFKAIARAIEGERERQIELLEDGIPVPFLQDLGVMTQEGKVVHSRFDKFRQINRFLEFIEDILPELDKGRELTILDFGCGKSYLTFAMYYYLHELKHYDIRIIGLDLKKDVIRHCNELSQKYGYEKLVFLEGNIADYTGVDKVDMVVTLHACDTATDFALAKAIGWDAKVILSVPCCQHELNRQIKNEVLEPVFKYGLIKERMAALVTDALRAEYLEREGYDAHKADLISL